MGGVVTYLVRDGVAIIEIDHPPLNMLTRQMCRDLSKALDDADRTEDVGAVILRARGRTFGSGTDGTAPDRSDGPTLRGICRKLDEFPKPVVAAIHGPVLGTGADLALAAHYRIAQRDTQIGFPEVRLGLLPSAGGVQRLARLVGADTAIRMLRSGRPIGASLARQFGLIDKLVNDKAGVASFALAKELIGRGAGPRPTMARTDHLSDPAAYIEVVAKARTEAADGAPDVEAEIVNCVEAALLLPAEEGLDFEFAAREGLRVSDTSNALCHVARAERRVMAVPMQLSAEPRTVSCVGIVGGGPAAIRLAATLLDVNHEVVLSERDEAALEDAYVRIGEFYDARTASGALAAEIAEASLDRLTMVCGFQAFTDAELIIDAASGDTAAAVALAPRIDAVAPAGAIIATLAPGPSVEALAAATSRPTDAVGLRLFGLGAVESGAEIVTLSDTSRHTVATLMSLLRQMGRMAVLSVDGRADGGICTAILSALQGASDALIAQGAEARTVRSALAAWGLAEGLLDRLDKTRDAAHAGLGQAAAVGGAAPADMRAQFPAPRRLSPETIQRTCLAAMVNAGARLVADDVARMPSDIDFLAVHGLGFARHTGGPMKAGDMAGLLNLRRALPRLGESGGIGGSPAPLLDDLIKNGRGFDSLNTG